MTSLWLTTSHAFISPFCYRLAIWWHLVYNTTKPKQCVIWLQSKNAPWDWKLEGIKKGHRQTTMHISWETRNLGQSPTWVRPAP